MKQSLTFTAVVIGALLGASALSVLAQTSGTWTAPTATPPGNNVPAPINVGDMKQAKTGILALSKFLFNSTGVSGSVATGSVLTALDSDGTVGWGAGGVGTMSNAYGSTLSTISIINVTTPMSWIDTGLSVTLTPASSNSKSLINTHIIAENGSASGDCFIGLFKNGVALVAPFSTVGGEGDNHAGGTSMTFLDQNGGTSPVTYSIKVTGDSNGKVCYINRSYNSATYYGVSTMTVLETN